LTSGMGPPRAPAVLPPAKASVRFVVAMGYSQNTRGSGERGCDKASQTQ